MKIKIENKLKVYKIEKLTALLNINLKAKYELYSL